MLVSYNWLKQYIDLTMTPSELVDKLNISGLPVEEVREIKAPFTGVVVAKVLAREKHPQADTLSLCEVTDGTETLKIVCGAPNVEAGQVVALAKVGAELPGGFKIKKARIRGIESNGMICSLSELGFEKESAGILVLDPAKFTVGSAYSPVKPDTVLSLEITPNRPDLLCITGVARFISSRTGLALKLPPCEAEGPVVNGSLEIKSKLKINLQEPSLCPRYAARMVEGVKVGPSPDWLKDALTAMGVRPINNIVDITNYVLFELNHPLHAFDYKKLKGSVINIRTAKKGEKLLALDTKTYEPSENDLVIADEKDPVALAGIMGGEHYSVDDNTVTVVIESAFFNPGTVRKTSRRLGVSSDSSYRFERGIDIETVTDALNRAAALMVSVAGGKASKDLIDIYPDRKPMKAIDVRYARVNSVLGTSFSARDIKVLMDSLYFPVNTVLEDRLRVLIPTYRVDMAEEIDVIEDIAQIHGYNSIPVTLPRASVSIGRETPLTLFNRSLAAVMTSLGFSEAYNYSFANNKLLKELKAHTFAAENPVALKNPFNDEETHLKTTLIPDLIKNLLTNYRNENEDIHLFESASVFSATASGYAQAPRFAAITYGHVVEPAFNKARLESDLYFLKSAIEAVYRSLNTDKTLSYSAPAGGTEFFEYFSDISIGTSVVGRIGQLKQEILYDNRLKQKAHMFELYTDALFPFHSQMKEYRRLSRFPGVKRDLSILVSGGTPEAAVESVILSDYRSMIKELKLYDLYRGEQVPEGFKSLTYSIVFQSEKKTLGDADVNKAMERIIGKLKAEVKAELRS